MAAHDAMDLAGERERVVERAQPHVAPEHDARGSALHVRLHLAQHRVVIVLLDAAREEHHHAPGRSDDAAQAGGRRLAQRAVRGRRALVVLARLVQLGQVGAQLLGHARRVVLREQRALAALRLYRAAARIGPHHEGHAQPLAVLAHAAELADLLVLAFSFRIKGTRPAYSRMYFSARPTPRAMAE